MSLEMLVERVEGSAGWRAEKAQQFPDDKRNARSSKALYKLAENLNALPVGHESLVAYMDVIERAYQIDGDVFMRISETESRLCGRYGFDYPEDGDPVDFLAALTEECRDIVEDEEERLAEQRREEEYEAAQEVADEAAKEAADEAAKKAAEEAAKEAAQEAYDQKYAEVYREVYEKTYREALVAALNRR